MVLFREARWLHSVTSGKALVRHGYGMLLQAGIPCAWRALTPPPSNPCHIRCNEKRRRKKSFFFFRGAETGIIFASLGGSKDGAFREARWLHSVTSGKALVRHGYGMLLQAGIPCAWRAREPTADRRATHSQTIRRLWFKPSLRQRKRERKSAPSRWRRDRDLNPGRHHCLTRFRIVRVQPLRHLCKTRIILQENGRKCNRFCPAILVFFRISLSGGRKTWRKTSGNCMDFLSVHAFASESGTCTS